MAELTLDSYDKLYDLMLGIWRSLRPEARPVYVACWEEDKYSLDELKFAISYLRKESIFPPSLAEIHTQVRAYRRQSALDKKPEEITPDPEGQRKVRELISMLLDGNRNPLDVDRF